MKPDLIFANAPFGKPGVDITKYIMENFPNANYAMLNTRNAFKKYYDKLACQYATIGKYLLGTNENLHWVEQAILLATNGWTEVIDNRKKGGENKVGMNSIFTSKTSYYECHTAHMVGTPLAIERATWHVNKSVDAKLRNGYIYVSFETFEEACECAIDIISWTDPTDSHYRCVRWGFVCGLRGHETYKESTTTKYGNNNDKQRN